MPISFIELNHLQKGSQVELSLQAHREPRYKLADLMAEMPAGKLPMVVGWDTLKPIGNESS